MARTIKNQALSKNRLAEQGKRGTAARNQIKNKIALEETNSDNVTEIKSEEIPFEKSKTLDPVKTEASTINPVESEASFTESEIKPVGRPRTTPQTGKHRGLQPGWERFTGIARSEYLEILKDYAYTKRTTLKDCLDEALAAYIASIDTSSILHRS